MARVMNRDFRRRPVFLIGLAVAAIFVPAGSAAERPVVSYISEGVKGGETFLIGGDGFQPNHTEVSGWVPEQPTAAEWKQPEIRQASLERFLKLSALPKPPPAAQPFAVIGQTATTLAAQSRNNKIGGSQTSVQAIWVRTPGGISDAVVVNRPIAWWSTPEFPEPGGDLRIFGKNLDCLYGAGRSAMLRDAGGKLMTVEWGTRYQLAYDSRLTPAYEFELSLPANLPAGNYELFLHNGSGGDWGWSEPHQIVVRSPLTPASRIVKAAECGVIPDDGADAGPAIQRAMDELASAGGGRLQLGPGTFLLKQTLRVPAGVTLQGNGEQSTRLTMHSSAGFNAGFTNLTGKSRPVFLDKKLDPLVALANQCGLEQLTVQGGSKTICAFIGGQGAAGQVSLQEVEFINRETIWHPSGEYGFNGNCVVLSGPIDGLQITNCRFEGESPLYGLPGLLRRAVIQGNHFQAYPSERSDLLALRDPVECLVENNFLAEGKRGIVVQPQPPTGMAVHNVFSRNVVEHIRRGGNAGELELWEISGAETVESVTAAGSDSLTAESAHWKTNALTGRLCLILDGRGWGQYRLIKANTGNELTVDPPWKIRPTAGAQFVVTLAAMENLILNDTDRDGDAALQFWGTAIGNVVAGEVMSDTDGAVLHGSDSRANPAGTGEIAPCWFNDFRQLRFLQGARLNLDATSKVGNDDSGAVPLVLGNTIRESAFGDGPRLPLQNQWSPFWEWPQVAKKIERFNRPGWEAAITIGGTLGFGTDPDDPLWNTLKSRVVFNLIERNYVEHWPVGIYEARSATNNLLFANQIMATQTNLVIIR